MYIILLSYIIYYQHNSLFVYFFIFYV